MEIPDRTNALSKWGSMDTLRRWRKPGLLTLAVVGIFIGAVIVINPSTLSVPLDKWVQSMTDWLTIHAHGVIQPVKTSVLWLLVRLERFLIWLPVWEVRSWTVGYGVIIPVGLLAWRLSGWRLVVLSTIGLLFIGNVGLWEHTMSTIAVVGTATLISVAVAIPMGIAMARSDTVEALMRPVLDLMQTMPSFVYLVPAILLLGLGKVPAVFATFIYAVPPAIRLTNLGIRLVDPELIEAARAFGTTSWQLLIKVQLPVARPNIMAGINQTIMMALAMVVLASMVGGKGLGAEILNGIARLEAGRAFQGGISIVFLAVIIDRLSQAFASSQRGRISQ